MTDAREVLSALIDGEPVDADAVAQMLEAPVNRALLVDFVRLRASVQADEGAVPEWRGDRLDGAMATAPAPPRAWLRVAAVLALLAAGAFGGTWVENVLTRERPPEPTRVVQLELVENR